MRIVKPYLFILLLSLTASLFAEKDKPLIIDGANWEKSIEGIDYTENYKEIDDPKPKSVDFTPLSYDWSGLKYVFYFIVIGLVIFLIIKILSNLNKNPNIKKQDISIESLEEIEEKIHEIDLEQLLNEAIESKNFHIALRINFLIIIKLLSEKGAINWAKEKTNWEYYSSIKDIMLKDEFKNIIIIFEPIWYGERNLTEKGFYALQPSFDSFKKQLKPNE